jgi:hypothetical protein
MIIVVGGGTKSFGALTKDDKGYKKIVKRFVSDLEHIARVAGAVVVWAGMPNPNMSRDPLRVNHPGNLSCDIADEITAHPAIKKSVYVFDFLTLNAYDRCTREISNQYGHGLEEFAGYRDKHFLPHLGANINLIVKKKAAGEIARH